jgi:hypothetical protein
MGRLRACRQYQRNRTHLAQFRSISFLGKERKSNETPLKVAGFGRPVTNLPKNHDSAIFSCQIFQAAGEFSRALHTAFPQHSAANLDERAS